jgi:hypothetical protein
LEAPSLRKRRGELREAMATRVRCYRLRVIISSTSQGGEGLIAGSERATEAGQMGRRKAGGNIKCDNTENEHRGWLSLASASASKLCRNAPWTLTRLRTSGQLPPTSESSTSASASKDFSSSSSHVFKNRQSLESRFKLSSVFVQIPKGSLARSRSSYTKCFFPGSVARL